MNISVVIPVYNAENFLVRAVESALFHNEVKEVVLVEDGSPDESLQVCENLVKRDDRIKLLRHTDGKNKGAGASRNLGIANATQDYISFLDADDFFTEIRFKKEKEIFSKNPDCDGVYGAIGTKYIDEIGAKAWEEKGLSEQTLTTVSKPIKPEHLFEYLIGFKNADNYRGYYSIDGFTVKRERLSKSNVWFDKSLKLHQDTLFMWVCANKLKLFTGEYKTPIAMRSVHEENRFIHNKNDNYTRYLLLKGSLKMVERDMLPLRYQSFFCNHYFNYMISFSNRMNVVPNFIKSIIGSKIYRKNIKFVQFKRVVHRIIFG